MRTDNSLEKNVNYDADSIKVLKSILLEFQMRLHWMIDRCLG